ncbi:nucleotide pyrophosphohydrolase [Streptomyces sp. NHF165]|uniref:nucleotide pyrophosphohydrolase n=1 Tax=Streptomyces sp. NHF165 TaxID=2175864 RepID=UPI0019171B3A|nr:nucleotide pyrophosphohydrolase [Streptomyces sp. NHF165]
MKELQDLLAQFAQERDWEQFHTPKNLAMALAGEAGELLEIFQWLAPDESQAIMQTPERAQAVEEEMADVFSYLLRLADVLDIDLAQALIDKVDKNGNRYPVHLSRGHARKYTQLGDA